MILPIRVCFIKKIESVEMISLREYAHQINKTNKHIRNNNSSTLVGSEIRPKEMSLQAKLFNDRL